MYLKYNDKTEKVSGFDENEKSHYYTHIQIIT